MKTFLIAASLLATPLLAQTAAVDAAGTWNITGEVAGVAVTEACTFTQSADGGIAGTCLVDGNKWPTTGAVKDGAVTFTHSGKYNGDDYTIVYRGKVDKTGALAGGMDVDPFGVSGTFTATKGTAPTTPAAK